MDLGIKVGEQISPFITKKDISGATVHCIAARSINSGISGFDLKTCEGSTGI